MFNCSILTNNTYLIQVISYTMEKKLNLGCGEFKKEGYINVDFFSASNPDIRHDLNKFPYPFADNEFNLIEANHVLEHLANPFMVMKELHRISKNGSVVVIKVPHFSRGFTHPEHKRGFDISFPLYFNPLFPGGYQGVNFELKRMRFSWFGQPYLKKKVFSPFVFCCGYALGNVIDFFANLFPRLCARIWCFWVGGFDEIEFVLSVKK